jgi:hypothetical protein
VSKEHIMDAKEHVKRDLLHFFRTYKAHKMSMNFGPLETHIRGYNDIWKDTLQTAIDELIAERLMEMQGKKLVLTEKTKEEILS